LLAITPAYGGYTGRCVVGRGFSDIQNIFIKQKYGMFVVFYSCVTACDSHKPLDSLGLDEYNIKDVVAITRRPRHNIHENLLEVAVGRAGGTPESGTPTRTVFR